MKPFYLLPLALLVALSACDTAGPGDTPRDGLSADLSALATVSGFGGVSYDASTRDGHGGPTLVVYTLGDAPDAVTQIGSRLSNYEYRLDRRPARGEATSTLVSQIEVLEPIAPIKDIGRTAHRIEINPTTGYAEVGVWTVFAASAYQYAMEQEGIPMDNVILMVEDRPASE
jgi:hypothetical protein